MALSVVLPAMPLDAQDSGASLYGRGRELMSRQKWAEAVVLFEAAERADGTIGDYILADMAASLEKLGRQSEAAATLDGLFARYPGSPLHRRLLLRRISLDPDPASALVRIDAYLAGFPRDEKALLQRAALLEKTGDRPGAAQVLQNVFTRGGPGALEAYGRLRIFGLTLSADDLEKAASGLYQRGEYRDVIELLNGQQRRTPSLALLLAKALFRTRNYYGAARRLKDMEGREARILLASSYLRAGDRLAAEIIFLRLAEGGAGDLYDLSFRFAEIKRRDGKTDDARKRLNEMLAVYPGKRDELLWNLAWLELRARRYDAAEKLLARLADGAAGAERDRYLYWLGKLAQWQGADGSRFFDGMSGRESYYSIRSGRLRHTAVPAIAAGPPTDSPRFRTALARSEALLAVGMKEQAAGEIKGVADGISSGDLNWFVPLLVRIDDYRTMVSLGEKFDGRPDLRYPNAFDALVTRYGAKNDVEPGLVLAIMREESRFNPTVRSVAGALGLMQLMPATGRKAVSLRRPEDLYEPEKNIEAGTRHLAFLLKRFGRLSHVIAAYNAGEHRVDGWLVSGYNDEDEFIEDIPFAETRNYTKNVLKSRAIYRMLYGR